MRTRPRTWWARAAATGVAAAALALSAPAAMACACGGMVSPDGGDGTSVDRETAVLHHDGERQTIHLQLGARGNATEAGGGLVVLLAGLTAFILSRRQRRQSDETALTV